MNKLNVHFAVVVTVALAGVIGCASQPAALDDPVTVQSLSLLMPAEIIIEPFTGVKSFDADDIPDGLEVVLRPVDSFGDPVKIAGVVRIELYHFQPASGEPKGRRIEQWDVAINTSREQETYWNNVTQMYEIPLERDVSGMSPDERYVLEVTYNTPLGEHMVSQYEFQPPLHRREGLAERP
jgi:hypothetical protein